MNFNLGDNKINIITVIVSIIIGIVISSFTICSCVSLKKEGFADINYNMSKDVPNDTWTNKPQNGISTEKPMYASLEDNVGGTIPPTHLDFFFDTKFHPKCCYMPNQYSSSIGCACISPDQMKYLSSRGGNHTFAYKTEGDIGV